MSKCLVCGTIDISIVDDLCDNCKRLYSKHDLKPCRICHSNIAPNYVRVCKECQESGIQLTRICSKCGEEKYIYDYYKDMDKWDGLKMMCKDCYRQYYQKKKKK